MSPSAAADAAIDQLFQLVDRDNDGVLNFSEVTALFQQLAPAQSAQSAQNAAVEALLMADRTMDARLSRREFGLMLAKVAEVSQLPLAAAAQRLLDVTQQQQTQQQQQPPAPAGAAAVAQQDSVLQADQSPAGPSLPQAAAAAAAAGAGAGAPAGSSQQASTPAAAAAQLRTLFDSWDKAGDGHINFVELCQGLCKIRQPLKHKKDITALITEAGRVLAAHDSDGDRQLDYQEFTSFISSFMGAAGFTLTDVLDDLITLSQSKPDNEKLQRVLDAANPQIQRMLSS